MAKRKKSAKKQAEFIPLFIVEGYTEYNYLKVLGELFKPKCMPKRHNCKGGSAKKVLFETKKLIEKHQDYYSAYIIIFDEDTEDKQANDSIKKEIENLMQPTEMLVFKPCFENWLLCHFEKQKSKNISCNQNEETLKKYIPNYEKNDCKLLEKYISKELVLFAVENEKFYGEIFKKYYPIE